MTFFSGELGGDEGLHEVPCQEDADDPPTEREDVGVVVFDGLMGAVDVVGE